MQKYYEDFYPRPPRGGRPDTKKHGQNTGYFYPRPPRGGRRFASLVLAGFGPNFYPRPPRGGRLGVHAVVLFSPIFLSTPSARRATNDVFSPLLTLVDFYPRPPRGGRLLPQFLLLLPFCISIHALREEGDRCFACCGYIIAYFYPRPPRGGRLKLLDSIKGYEMISIHALREEGDRSCSQALRRYSHFYPRPPRGGRRIYTNVSI